MKRFLTYLLSLAGMIALISCNGITDVSPKGKKLESNYYQTPDQIYAALVAAYNPIAWQFGGTDQTYMPVLLGLNAATDECFTGGGGKGDMAGVQAWDDYDMSPSVGPQAGYWDRSFTGINRANLLLQKIDHAKGLSQKDKKRYIAEAKFLRGYYYFWLIRLFKNVPLFTKPLDTGEIYQQEQAPPDSVYAQIESDFSEAIPDLSSAPLPAGEQGRATKGAARAFLAKTLMWDVGSGSNSTKMGKAVSLLDKVNTNPAYHLLSNYPDIFKTSNKFNAESIFEIPHSGKQKAGYDVLANVRGNLYAMMVNPRSYTGPTYAPGWSFNPITLALVDSMQGDPRAEYTILDISTIPGASYAKVGYDRTGYFVKKFAAKMKYQSAAGDPHLNYPKDYIEVRLAGTYLLEAEALVRSGGSANTTHSAKYYLNQVRARVGLSPAAPTLKNIYHEMFMELATEGHRWFHLVRTGRAGAVLGRLGYDPAVNDVLPIPQESLNNTKLKQNPGYQ